jgi:hypothetical protein
VRIWASPPPSLPRSGTPPSISWLPTLPTPSVPGGGSPPSKPSLLGAVAGLARGFPSLALGDVDWREGIEEGGKESAKMGGPGGGKGVEGE